MQLSRWLHVVFVLAILTLAACHRGTPAQNSSVTSFQTPATQAPPTYTGRVSLPGHPKFKLHIINPGSGGEQGFGRSPFSDGEEYRMLIEDPNSDTTYDGLNNFLQGIAKDTNGFTPASPEAPPEYQELKGIPGGRAG
jgi:hypothetical protein